MINNNSQIKTFWSVFFAVVALLAIGACVVTTISYGNKLDRINMSVVSDENVYKISRENTLRQSLYLVCDGVKNLEVNLGKTVVSNNGTNQAKMLTNVVVCANAVNQSFVNLPLEQSDKLIACGKFVNQTQDYAKYLVGKLASGQKLSLSEKHSLHSLQNVAGNLYEVLQGYAESDSGLFMTNGNGNFGVGALSQAFDDVDDDAFNYETLVYDGPFSDTVAKRAIPVSTKITVQQGKEKVSQMFGEADYLYTSNGESVLYVYQTSNGQVSLSLNGDVVEYDGYEQNSGNVCCKEKCVAVAEEFCQKLGYDVKGVWVSRTADFVTYVNCAPIVDGVVRYPQLVKVAVDGSGNVVALQANLYLCNKDMPSPQFGNIEQKDVNSLFDRSVTITDTIACVVNKDGTDYACWQVECLSGGKKYYVCVDSTNGNEIDIVRLVDTDEGFTLL